MNQHTPECDHGNGYCREGDGVGLSCNEPETEPIIRRALEDALILIQDEREHPGCHRVFDFSCVEGALNRALSLLRSPATGREG